MCMLTDRSLKAAAKVKNDLFAAKQNKFAKLNSTHGKGHQKKEKSNFNNKKEAQCSSKIEQKKSRVTKVKLNEVCLCSLVVCTRHNIARINLTVFNQNISFS